MLLIWLCVLLVILYQTITVSYDGTIDNNDVAYAVYLIERIAYRLYVPAVLIDAIRNGAYCSLTYLLLCGLIFAFCSMHMGKGIGSQIFVAAILINLYLLVLVPIILDSLIHFLRRKTTFNLLMLTICVLYGVHSYLSLF